MVDLKKIRKWHSKKLSSRVMVLSKEMVKLQEIPTQMDLLSSKSDRDRKMNALLDEAVVICLASLVSVTKEIDPDEPFSALDSFEEIYREEKGTLWELIFARFRETREMIQRYTSSGKMVKNRLRPQLLARGML